MLEKNRKINDTQNPPIELSVKNLQVKKSQNNNNKKKIPLRLQTSKPSKNSVKIQPSHIPVHFTWALTLTILCFFVIGPCWALYKTYELRRMIKRKEFEAAACLSNKIATVLLISTIVGVFVWIAFLFCSVGLILIGILLNNNYI
ncbi:unnamed protein product [Rotaria sordida]|uniref:Uncharacterized protein n=1 Tax=Rotaria sordida TaxID=392033 RepID=A0A814XF61_9BILA|nr:unnamed protein product [Rotaria sordida]CAF1305698.1 unnamed protein product [Rotaria sordida]CAF1332115.1 unnamed protein product [Rotaria sordida]CAF3772058.1 unnamed protein product [Rotaria sordida]CAF3825453.1 unnamed protein product [Rotaria sordida]